MILGRGSSPRGLFLKLPAPQIVEMAALARFDFVVVDLEHSALTDADCISLLRVARLAGIPALVRLPSVDRGAINRYLEEGAVGIQLASVTRVDEVVALRAATRMAPSGRRSVSTTNAMSLFGALSLADYVSVAADSPPILVVQIETAHTVDPVASIIGAGADVVFIGSVDLTVSLDFDANEIRERERAIREAAVGEGALLGGMAGADTAWDYTIVGSDLSVLQTALRSVTRV
ncbi:aldolase/citrate lyase family protein [Lacisediminihabitans profunda]|uniref:HpcH/HpaI aldolase/citrate lyase domain-containing protein n=1 Tax=Lacisediminihabitans profunda TaxID=2594790 RepID=A0A5C8UM31_9MICO|nr:aldolase/citrate lyase family protein [Lacisediminihabitans profunda]TXN28934.1 hypothetical protein FVP33_15540 [Lacisediminihabitans profunda]